jgi:flagellar protein FlaG
MKIQSVMNGAAVAQLSVGNQAVSGGASQSTGQAAAQPATPSPATPEQTQRAVDIINKVVQVFNNGVEFSVDESTGINLVRVVDKSTKEVIRQLPVEAVISFARTLDSLQGLLIKQRV